MNQVVEKPVDGCRGALLKLHADIRLNCWANWTCLLAGAPIYVHSLLQLVHLHYWNGLSSGLCRVLQSVQGEGGRNKPSINKPGNKTVSGAGAVWRITPMHVQLLPLEAAAVVSVHNPEVWGQIRIFTVLIYSDEQRISYITALGNGERLVFSSILPEQNQANEPQNGHNLYKWWLTCLLHNYDI